MQALDSQIITKMQRPPFRADQVGSLLRPDRLKQARERLLSRLHELDQRISTVIPSSH